MYRSIQVCRAIAAGLVMLLHLTAHIANPKYFGLVGINAPFQFGHAGVEFFFVLSGFIVTFVHWNDFGNPSRLANYAKKRSIRVYPTYWLILAAVYPIGVFAYGNIITLTPAALLTTLTLVPQPSPDPVVGTVAPILGVAWSLQYEMLFYVLMAIYVVNRLAGGLISLAVLTNLVACKAGHCIAPAPYLHTYFPLLFGLGALTAICCKQWPILRQARLLAVLGVVAFLLIGVWDNVTGERLTLAYGVASAAIVLGLVKAEDSGKLRVSWDWMVLVGDSSYVLYLIHAPVITALCQITVRIGLHGLTGALVSMPIIIAVCIGLAISVHRFVEKPLLRAVFPPPRNQKIMTVRC